MVPPLAGLPEEDQIGYDLLGDVQVDDPVHQVEADEADREEDAAVLVNVGGRDAAHLLQVLLAVKERGATATTSTASGGLMQHQLIFRGSGRTAGRWQQTGCGAAASGPHQIAGAAAPATASYQGVMHV